MVRPAAPRARAAPRRTPVRPGAGQRRASSRGAAPRALQLPRTACRARAGSGLSARARGAGHRLRYELEDWWAKDPIAGSELGVKNMKQTQADMQNAVFCVCPPGAQPAPAAPRM